MYRSRGDRVLHEAVVLGLLLGSLAGCGERGPRRFRIRGTVTYAGKPVQLGRVLFEPDAVRGNQGPQGFAPIENGTFDTAGPHCRGVVGGPMRVRIDGFEMIGGEDAAASGKLLFPTHEEAVDLPQADAVRHFMVPPAPDR